MNSLKHDIADPFLYRVYYGLILTDILCKLGMVITQDNKNSLHDYHKRVLGYESIASAPHATVSHFLFLVCVHWAQLGIFVRTKEDQPMDILDKPLKEVWKYL